MPTTWTDDAGADYLDTVALLQDEIARLEDELRRRDEEAVGPSPEPPAAVVDGEADAKLGELAALLADRDETIGLLCDQLAAIEEVGAARTAEWEQLDGWVRQLEERIDRDGQRPAADVEAAREAEALRDRLESQERAWGAERARLDQEIAWLRARQAEAAARAGDHDRAAVEAENQRLRDECLRLAALEVAAAEAEALRERSRELQEQCDQARRDLDLARDDLARERVEREAELAALRASLASAKAIEPAAPAASTADERIRALRLHLREIHEREAKEREERQLVNRLSRLWRRPAPRS